VLAVYKYPLTIFLQNLVLIQLLLQNLNIHHCVHESLPLDLIFMQLNLNHIYKLNIAAEGLVLLLYIQEVLGSNLGPVTISPEETHQANAGIAPYIRP
jgi:hypothetical protein